jgi:hypothetical protein
MWEMGPSQVFFEDRIIYHAPPVLEACAGLMMGLRLQGQFGPPPARKQPVTDVYHFILAN